MKWFWAIPYPIRAAGMLVLTCVAFLVIGRMYRLGPQAKEKVWSEQVFVPPVPVAVTYGEDYADPARAAITVWNSIMPDAEPLFVVASEDTWEPREVGVRVFSANGEPCGKFSVHEVEGHSATAYRCPGGSWEIHIAKPGHIRTQLCIIAHELGHVLGLADDGNSNKGVMNQYYCPDVHQGVVRPSDKDTAAVRELYKQESKDGGPQD